MLLLLLLLSKSSGKVSSNSGTMIADKGGKDLASLLVVIVVLCGAKALASGRRGLLEKENGDLDTHEMRSRLQILTRARPVCLEDSLERFHGLESS